MTDQKCDFYENLQTFFFDLGIRTVRKLHQAIKLNQRKSMITNMNWKYLMWAMMIPPIIRYLSFLRLPLKKFGLIS